MFFYYLGRMFEWMPPILLSIVIGILAVFVASVLIRIIKLIVDVLPFI